MAVKPWITVRLSLPQQVLVDMLWRRNGVQPVPHTDWCDPHGRSPRG